MIAVIFTAFFPHAGSHAVLYEPKARNWVAHQKCQGGENCPQFPPKCEHTRKPGCKDYDPQSLNANGPPNIKKRGDGSWPSPVGAFGLCGDPVQFRANVPLKDEPYMLPTPPQAVYTAGDIVEFQVGIYAEHFGHYEFRICDKALDGSTLKSHQEGQDCLNKWVLKRAPPSGTDMDSQPIDTKHPGRWYVGAKAKGLQASFFNSSVPIAGKDWDDRDAIGLQVANVYKMRYIIPEDLKCEACTLQWYWPTANTCAYDKDVGEYWKRNGMSAVGATTVCGTNGYGADGEEFWNCADITVKPKANPTPAPPPAARRRRRSSRRRTSGRRRRRSSRRRSSRRRRRTSRRRSSRRRR